MIMVQVVDLVVKLAESCGNIVGLVRENQKKPWYSLLRRLYASKGHGTSKLVWDWVATHPDVLSPLPAYKDHQREEVEEAAAHDIDLPEVRSNLVVGDRRRAYYCC